MLTRLLAAAALLALAGCPTPPKKITCSPPSCVGKPCGYSECGVTCASGSGCVNTHQLDGAISVGGGAASAAGGHAVSGALEPAAAPAAAASGGHSIDSARLSP